MEAGKSARMSWCWTLGAVQFDEAAWQLRVDGEPIRIERKPLEVLLLLFHNAGEVVTRQELLESVWAGRHVVDGVLTNAVGKLRKAFGNARPTIIATAPGVGYRLVGKVHREAIDHGAAATRLHPGDAVPRRPGWQLVRALDADERGEVRLAARAKSQSQRVYKFSFDGARLDALKREVTISRLLRESLGECEQFVPVTDWNFTDAPYFIESRFAGPNLEAWADDQGGLDAVPLEERIELLARTAEAVAMAHEVGVLHKDLKPANVLVQGSAGDWQPCLVDFGSGRVLEPDRLEALGITRLGLTQTQAGEGDSLTGTLRYLAPELQTGQVPTVRSDIYALGIILYQLCVGDLRRALSPGWEADIADPMLREDIAATVNGNPELRLASARELALRLRRREQRASQRHKEREAARQAARNERALAAARARRPWMLAGVLLLLGGFLVTLYMYRMVAAANTRAVREKQQAQAVTRFLNRDLLAAANPIRGGHPDISLLDAINRAEPAIDIRFAKAPLVAATLHQTLGDAYNQLGDYTKARQQYQRAAALFARAGDGTQVQVAGAQLREVRAMAHAVQGQAARQRLDDLWPGVMRLAARSPKLKAAAFWTRGAVDIANLDLANAVAALRKAKKLLDALPHADPYVVRAVRRSLDRAKINIPEAKASELRQAEQHARAELAAADGKNTVKALQARKRLLSIRIQRGQIQDLEQEYRDLLADYARVNGPQDTSTLFVKLLLEGVYSSLARWQGADRIAREVYKVFNKRFGPGHRNTLNAAMALAIDEMHLGHLERAQALLDTGIAQLQGKDDTVSRLFRNQYQLSLVHLRLAQGRVTEARALLSTARAGLPKLLQHHPSIQGDIAYLDGRIKLREGNPAGARASLQAALKLLRQRHPDSYWAIQKILRIMPDEATTTALAAAKQ